MCCCCAYFSSAVYSGTMSAETNFRWSAMMTIWSMNRSTTSFDSIICGAMYLPFDVLKRSFIRSVRKSSPLRMYPASPVWNHPCGSIAASVSAVLR